MSQEESGKPIKCHRGEWVDIGHDVKIRRAFLNDELHGVDYQHDCSIVQGRESYIPCARDGLIAEVHWRLHSEEPLTLSPSLLCPFCGHHGFIRDGLWVSA